MKNKLIVVLFLGALVFAIWSYKRMGDQSGLGPVKSFEEAIGQEFVSLLGDHRPKRVVVLIDQVFKGQPEEPSRLKGIRRALAARGMAGDALSIAYVPRDPQDAQEGRPTFPFQRLLDITQASPGCDTLLVWSDIPFPSSAERQQLDDRGVTVYTMPNDTSAARKMLEVNAIGGAVVPRTEVIATPGGYVDPAARVKNEFERLLR